MKILKDISQIVQSERKKRKMTQAELAEYCNVGRRFIVELESAEKETLTLGSVVKVLQRLGADLAVLSRGKSE